MTVLPPSRTSGLLPAALLVYIGACYALPKGNGSAVVFCITVLPALAAALRAGRGAAIAAVKGDPAWALALALVLFSGLTLLWGDDDHHRSGQFLIDTLGTLGFVLAMPLAWRAEGARRNLAALLTVAGAANAVFAIGRALILSPLDPRLHGWGLTVHPILGALVMQTAFITALWRGLSGTGLVTRRPRAERAASLAAALAMGAFILMTESRGPILSGAIVTLLICLAGKWRARALAALAAIAAAWWALPRGVQQHSTQVLVHRGTSHRIEIWEYAARLIGNRPILGHGLAANMHLNVGTAAAVEDITFPHDLYLSLLFYSGVAGLALFAALVLVLARRLWRGRAAPETLWFAALCLGALLGGLTDLGQVTKGPGPIWIILWVPLGLAIAGTARPSPARNILKPA